MHLHWLDHNHHMHIYSHTVIPPLPHIDDYHLYVQPPPLPHMTTTIWKYNHHHDIKIQPPPHSASCNVCLFVCAHISKCGSAPRKNTTSASCSEWWRLWLQVEYFRYLVEGKHHQRKLHSVNTILGTSIGTGCSNQMQLAQRDHLPCATCNQLCGITHTIAQFMQFSVYYAPRIR